MKNNPLNPSVSITAVHLDVAYTKDRTMGTARVLVEIDGEWLELVNASFDPDGFHISHIIEANGIRRLKTA